MNTIRRFASTKCGAEALEANRTIYTKNVWNHITYTQTHTLTYSHTHIYTAACEWHYYFWIYTISFNFYWTPQAPCTFRLEKQQQQLASNTDIIYFKCCFNFVVPFCCTPISSPHTLSHMLSHIHPSPPPFRLSAFIGAKYVKSHSISCALCQSQRQRKNN